MDTNSWRAGARAQKQRRATAVVVLGALWLPFPPAGGERSNIESEAMALPVGAAVPMEPRYDADTPVYVDYDGVYPPPVVVVPSAEPDEGGLDVDDVVHAVTGAADDVSPYSLPEVAVRPPITGCGQDYPCYRYQLVLAGKRRTGERLRFAIDYREPYLNWEKAAPRYDVVMLDAAGTELSRAAWAWNVREAEASSPVDMPWRDEPANTGISHGHLEVFVDDPTEDAYQVVVIAQRVRDANTGFQPRVKLEHPYRPSPNRRLLLPDLQPLVPYELALGNVDNCIEIAGELQADPSSACDPNTDNFDSCLGVLDDPQQNATLPCSLRLRFSYGYRNAGEGPLRVEFRPLEDTSGGDSGTAVQRIFREPDERDAYQLERSETHEVGPYHLHAAHQHYHYDPMFEVELYSYDPGTGERSPEPLSVSPKVGNCGHDWFMADFMTSFDQDPRGTEDSDGCLGLHGSRVDNVVIALSAGWGDTYGRQTGDSYVPFATRTESGTWERLDDGDYLLVETVNIDGAMTESDMTDNVGYTHLKVGPGGVCIVERGLGESPNSRTREEPLGWRACA